MFKSRTVPIETPQQVHDAMARGEIVLIDVREPSEFAVERIHGAMLFPLSTFDPAGLPDAVGKQIVLQCGSGKRSEMAFQKAFSAGVLVRSHMGGGIMAWKAAGLPVVSTDPSTGAVRDRF
ncbi:MAG TPA: rhodanese-like domain-containing protein [Hyphomonadaceae bacterium]|jgi:rhodanese-related sulfurtransferase|nr:rhodanese-like domain-containing protein [Hyphomonadaceae bacterium]